MSEQLFERDRWGNPICGQDFMAGTICTRAPGHEGFHAPECQTCGGDWYDETCTCSRKKCVECGDPFDPNDDEAGWGNLCWGCCCEEEVEIADPDGVVVAIVQCYGVIDHDGPHITTNPEPLPASPDEIEAAIKSIEQDMPAVVIVFKDCIDCGQSIGCTMGGDPPTCKTHN